MKKILIVMCGILLLEMLTGCGKNLPLKNDNGATDDVEKIKGNCTAVE